MGCFPGITARPPVVPWIPPPGPPTAKKIIAAPMTITLEKAVDVPRELRPRLAREQTSPADETITIRDDASSDIAGFSETAALNTCPCCKEDLAGRDRLEHFMEEHTNRKK